MKYLLVLLLLLPGCWNGLRAQTPAAGQAYTDARAGYRLTYPPGWWVQQTDNPADATFYVGASWRQALAVVTLTIRPLPDARKDLNQLSAGQADTLRRTLSRLPQAQVLALTTQDAGTYQEARYDYTYAPAAPAAPARVVGRRLWRNGYEYRLEYRAPTTLEPRYPTEGRRLVESLVLIGKGLPSRRYPDQACDDKMYGIAALRFDGDQWQDDCQTIHEFSTNDPGAAPTIHRRALPFQSYALAKGFDNCLYSVTKAPTDAPEYVYRYDPAIRQGRYTHWQLPAQGPETVWIAAATDARGDLYFITADASQLVRVSPADDAVTVVWTADPVRQAPYFAAIGFAGAGTHANFCFDETGTLVQVYSTDGALLQINLATRQPVPDLLPLDGLPQKGGYSDLLLQYDAAGRRRLYLAGPKALYEIDLVRHRATRVRGGVYTDLAGCNLFRRPPPPVAAALPAASAPAWRGRVLDAVTRQPLPRAQFRLRANGRLTTIPLTEQAGFTVPTPPGQPLTAQLQLAGYLASDSTYQVFSGASAHDILLRPLAVGTTLALDKVQFAQGQAVLLPSSFPALDQLLALLTQNAGLTIELRGHTDNVGNPDKNLGLSEQRVEAVKTYLVGHGVAAARISGRGLGGTEPRASNEREVTRQLNRRVEFRVTGVR
ncbi:OmpA family protein [Hymenobacter algoricola]|uniref:OmpA-like domain-containing protein n=1 Tax=Hymenobacter algoricola TaxID=486267 RepID=A0ABP7ML71_9BACT